MPSNLERKARRKRQTRLTFGPVDLTSSPPTANMSPAKVRYELPRTRQTRQTPASSVQLPENDSESDEILTSSKKHNLRTPAPRKSNGKLPFKPLPTPAKSSQTQVKADGSSFDCVNDLEDEVESEAYTTRPLRSASKQTSTSASKAKQHMAGLGLDGSYSSSDGSEPEEENYTPSKAKPSKKTTKLTSASPLKKSPFKKQATGKPVRPIPVVFDSDSDEEADLEAAKNSPRGKKLAEAAKLVARTMRCSDEKARREKSITLSDSEDEIVRPSQPRTLFRPAKSMRSSNAPPDITSSRRRGKKSVIVEDSEDDDPIISSKPSQSSALRNPKLQIDSIGAEEDSEPISPLKRRRPSTYFEDDSDDDLPSPSKVQKKAGSTSATTPRTTRQQKKRTHRTEKEKKFELLKRKRAGEKIEELTESESSEDAESDDDLHALEDFDDEEESPDQVRKPAEKQKRNKNADGDESDFIVEDDEGPLGIPDYSLQIPLQFTHAAHKPLKDHFRDVIEWMVHKKTNPGFTWDDEVYTQAFFKLNHEYSGYAQSKFVSTQWTASFTRALSARPLLYIRGLESEEAINILGEAKCEICNHRKHISTYALKFAGKPYHKENLEDVDQSDGEDSDASSNSDKNEVNSQGIKIPPEEKEYLGGRICKSNAEQAHTLIHWKWNLNQWVLDNLEAEGYLTPAKIVEREKMKTKQRRDYANAIVDQWERDGQIKSLYRDFKGQREVAREAKGSGGSGWSRS